MKKKLRTSMLRAAGLLPESLQERLLRAAIAVVSDDVRFRIQHVPMFGSLRNMSRAGFKPSGMIDVGAHVGSWARKAVELFPGVPIHMVEAQPNLERDLRRVANDVDGASYTICLLGAEPQERVAFYLLNTGSSVFEELTTFPKEAIELPVRRLDDVAEVAAMRGPLLLKLDVQGSELQVLLGATQTLEKTEAILTEVSLLPYNNGAPLMHDVVAFLNERGFLCYDICEGLRRSSDLALFQVDMLFVRRNSELRRRRQFWSTEPAEVTRAAL